MSKKRIVNDKEEIIKNFNIKSLQDLDDFKSQLTQAFVNNALEAEMDEHLGYKKWDQNSRTISKNYRKGKTSKTINTQDGPINIQVPHDQQSTFNPMLIPKYSRTLGRIEDSILLLYAKGTSTRDIEEIIREMYQIEISKDLVSRITEKLMPEINAWMERPLDKIYPIIFVDGIRFKVKEDMCYKEKSIYIIIGINIKGYSEIIGFWIGESESASYWLTIFNELKSRGVEEILIACSDNLKGLSDAFLCAFPNIKIQKCIIHQIRNSTKHVAAKDLQPICLDMRKIYASATIESAKKELINFTDTWSKKYKSVTDSWINNFDELTTYFQLPIELRKVIYTTNLIENVNRQIRKITKTRGAFPTSNAIVKLVYLKLKDITLKSKRKIRNWGQVYEQLKIMYPNRLKNM